MPVAAAVIGDADKAALFAAFDMATEGRGAAVLDRRHDLQLVQAQMTSLGGTVAGACRPEDIGDLQ